MHESDVGFHPYPHGSKAERGTSPTRTRTHTWPYNLASHTLTHHQHTCAHIQAHAHVRQHGCTSARALHIRIRTGRERDHVLTVCAAVACCVLVLRAVCHLLPSLKLPTALNSFWDKKDETPHDFINTAFSVGLTT